MNNGPNCNHGGEKGFAFRTFTVADTTEDSVTFALHSPDGEEGYPANLDVAVTYRIEGSTLVIEYDATPDGTTLINLTNHAYFNLDGQATYIGDHWLEIQADAYGHVDGDILFTGETEDVTGTIFDFRKSRRIGEALESGDGQIETATGLDHPFLLNRETDAVRLYSEKTGISMTVSSSCPVCQIYSGNFLAGETGKDGQPMNRQTAVCIETSYAADDINIRNEQSKTIVKKGESWKEWTSFRFETDHESQ